MLDILNLYVFFSTNRTTRNSLFCDKREMIEEKKKERDFK